MRTKNLLVAQSGGPTAAINATLAGVIEAGMKSDRIDRVYGGFFGSEGILQGQIIDIGAQIKSDKDLHLLSLTPGMALRSCRHKMPDPQKDPAPYEAMLDIFKALDIGYFFYIGGNDSMDTAMKLHRYCADKGHDIKVIGVPKTIDNDLPLTDHTPGFGSAVKYVACSIAEIARDSAVYTPKSAVVVEIMGRDAGWLTAGSGVAQLAGGAPHLIYIPETPFDPAACVAAVKTLQETIPHVVIAVSEGIRDREGDYVHTDLPGGITDAFGHRQLAGAGRYVETLIKQEVGCKVRSIELSVLQRAAGHCLAAADIDEAIEVGRQAVALALAGESGKMAAIERIAQNPYKSRVIPVDLDRVAGKVRPFPTHWLSEDNRSLSEEALDYFLPLIQGEKAWPSQNGLPHHFIFRADLVSL